MSAINIKNLIKVNLINIALLLLVVLIYIIFNNVIELGLPVTLGATGLAGVIWFIFTLYSNYSILNTEDDPFTKVDPLKRFMESGKRGAFSMERKKMATMYNSILAREKYFGAMEKDSRMVEAYTMIRLQAENDLGKAADFFDSYDYVYGVYGRDTAYLKKTMDEMQGLVTKLNQLVELSYSLDDNIKDVDIRRVDDLIESLETMKTM